MKHFARIVNFTTLYQHLLEEVKNGNVYEIQQDNLSLFCYTNHCVYNRLWNEWNILARGLIIDRATQKVIATPFSKFFNYGELSDLLPDQPFDVYEKLDGSLGIAYYYQDNWYIATKGSFDSAQAIWGTQKIQSLDKSFLEPGTTYLFELVYSDNQIVIKYSFSGLVLLSAYSVDGEELSYDYLSKLAEKLNINIVQKLDTHSIDAVLQQAVLLDRNSEGFVLHFTNGLRLKIKGSEYCRIHKLISGVTPLGIWKCLKDGDDLELFRQEIPEEFWPDFDQIHQLLVKEFSQVVSQIEIYHQQYIDLSDKELGLRLNTLSDLAKKFIFYRRKDGELWYRSSKVKEKLFALIRPTDNYLDFYSESRKLKQVQLEN
ncbi:T4 RnlA family RNA ligase [Aphanothece hegewaldii]|nr:T4 RnlA family RNA ligase [Aphanothece hegewaldii]